MKKTEKRLLGVELGYQPSSHEYSCNQAKRQRPLRRNRLGTERVKKVLRRHHDKVVTQKKRDPQSEVEHTEPELIEDEIIPSN